MSGDCAAANGQIGFHIELLDSLIDILLFRFPATIQFDATGSVGVGGFFPGPDRERGSVSKVARETDWIGDQSVRVRSIPVGFTASAKEIPRRSSFPATERLGRSRDFEVTQTQRAAKEVIPSNPNLQTTDGDSHTQSFISGKFGQSAIISDSALPVDPNPRSNAVWIGSGARRVVIIVIIGGRYAFELSPSGIQTPGGRDCPSRR
jgi:hypothetical protein